MIFGLLWIESLLVCLLFAVFLITVGLRRKSWIARYALCGIGIFPPMLALGSWAAVAAFMRIKWGMQHSGLVGAVALLLCYVGGVAAIVMVAARHDAGGVCRAFFWSLGRLAAAWLVVVALLAMTFWNMDLQSQVQVQALRAEAGALALSVVPPPIPDADNAARLYELATQQYQAATVAADKDVDYSQLDLRSPEVAEYLQRQQKALEIVRRAADMPGCRFERDYSKLGRDDLVSELVPQLGRFRADARLLALAAKAEATNGSTDLALADCRRIYAIGAHAGSPPTLISVLVTMAIDGLADETVVKVLPCVTSRAPLAAFAAPDPRAMALMFDQALRAEEALGLASFCDFASGSQGHVMTKATRGTVWFLWMREDLESYRDLMRREQVFAQQPYYEATAAQQRVEGKVKTGQGYGPLTRIIASALQSELRTMAKAQARESSVAVACAATCYRLDHGAYPPTAALLVPAYLAAIPTDPFDGRPMRFKKRDDGSVAIYSVGPDGVDDGGQVEGRKSTNVGIILKLPIVR
jgi:hypothetical protein